MDSSEKEPSGPGPTSGPTSGPGSSPRAPLPSIPTITGGDWPAQAADLIVTSVDKVRDRTTVPLMTLARAAVFGVFIGTFVVVLCTLLVIGLIRLLDLVIPGGVWLPYLLLGVVVTGLGALLFRKRNEPVVGRTSAR